MHKNLLGNNYKHNICTRLKKEILQIENPQKYKLNNYKFAGEQLQFVLTDHKPKKGKIKNSLGNNVSK